MLQDSVEKVRNVDSVTASKHAKSDSVTPSMHLLNNSVHASVMTFVNSSLVKNESETARRLP